MIYHKRLGKGEWHKLNLMEQMANIGSEVSRTINWKGKKKSDADHSYKRALELLCLTMKDPKNAKRLKEIARVRELFIDWYLEGNLYKTTITGWQNYFLQFAIASRINK